MQAWEPELEVANVQERKEVLARDCDNHRAVWLEDSVTFSQNEVLIHDVLDYVKDADGVKVVVGERKGLAFKDLREGHGCR